VRVDGSFTQEDPIGIAGGLNLYGYANGDPVNFSDPFGLFPDLLLDLAFLAADLNDIRKNGLTFGRAATFGADVVLAAIPFAPAATGSAARFLGRTGGQVADLALNIQRGKRKGSQMVARFRSATGSTGGLDAFLGHARGLAEEAFQGGTFVSGTVGRGANALENATIFRRGDDFLWSAPRRLVQVE
jgi:uncharacterized protein RhaS with RHS repeats